MAPKNNQHLSLNNLSCLAYTKSFAQKRQFDRHFDLKSEQFILYSMDLSEDMFRSVRSIRQTCAKPSQFFTINSAHEIMIS